MESEQEPSASSLASDLLEARNNEDSGAIGVDSEGLEGVNVRQQGLSSREQANVELLIQFDGDEVDSQGILQPQVTSSGTEKHSDDERLEEKNNSVSQESDRYESTDPGFGTHADDDDGHDDDDEYKNRYVLSPQQFRIHVGAEADISFGIHGIAPQVQNTEQDTQQKPPQLLFTTDERTEYTADGEEFGYIRKAEPSPPEADLSVEDETPELQFEPDVDDAHDEDESSHIRRAQPPAPEEELKIAREYPELQFEPKDVSQHDEIDRDLRQYQPSAPEDELETTREYPELQFEPEESAEHDEIDRDLRQYQPSAPEDELETAKKFSKIEFEPEDTAEHDEIDRYLRQYQPSAPEDELETAKKSSKMEFEPEDATQHDGDFMNHYFRESQPAPEDDVENAHGSPKIQFEREAEADHDNDDDDNRYFATEADTEADQESPELHFEPDDEEYQYTHHSQPFVPEADLNAGFSVRHSDQYGDDEDGDDDEGNGHAPESQRVHDADEEMSLEIPFQPADDKIDNGYFTQSQTSAQQVDPDVSGQQFKASDAGDDDGCVGVGGDGSHHTSQLRNAVQAGVEDESLQLESPPSYILHATASHDGDDDNNGDGRSYMTHKSDDQSLGIAREHQSDAGTQGFEDNEDSPRVFIKKISSEDSNFDERYAGNEYQEENEEEEEEDDVDDAIDIRDNANVDDQFIEFEDTPYVEAPVDGILEDAGLNGAENGSQEERLANEAGDDDVGDASASSSSVRFAEEDHQADDVDDYHIIAGASDMPSYSSHDYNLDEGGEKSLDVLLLEEICEEAASMTIKEALIHSLKPNVRAGLTTAHLKLSESEVLALEEYCEDFVGGLIKDLLKRSSVMDLSSKNTTNVVKASVIKSTAKQLSAMEVQQMKKYCDHFVHNVLAESIIDSSMIVARQQHQAEEVKEVLHMFHSSDELQEYFTNLTTDIVRTALLNVTAKEDLQNDSQDIEQPINSMEYEQTESAEGMEYGDQEDDFDFDGGHSFGFLAADNKSTEYRRSRSQESWTSEDDREMGASVAGGRERTRVRSPPGHSTLEFDEDWAEGVIGKIDLAKDGERRQKIFMRELEFDDRANVGGMDLLAPVFLAVAEENEDDTEFVGLRRKTQSIEDLCDLIEEEKEPPRKRASSLTQLAKKKPKPRKKPRPNSFHEQMEELKKEAIKENIADAEPEEERPALSSESASSPKTSSEKSFQAYDDERYRWHTIRINNREKVLDLKLIEPYMKVITHGGVHTPTRAVIVVIAACYLPDKTKRNYDFLMEQLFFYLISTLELLATTDEYFLVYFNGGTTQNNQPALPWMKRFYQHVEGGLKKNMIHMFIVHPNFWLKTVVRVAKAFVGTNFWSKLHFIKSLDELSTKIPVEFIYVPDEVIRCDPKYKRVHNL